MAGPEPVPPGDAIYSRLRASHADRDRVIDTLKSAYVLGFLTKGEFEARVSQTLAARTYAELAVVATDLPPSLATVQPPRGRVPDNGGAPARATLRPVDRAIVACALFAAAAFAAAIVSNDGWLAFGAVCSALASLAVAAVQMGTGKRPGQPGGHPTKPELFEADSATAAVGSGTEAAGSGPVTAGSGTVTAGSGTATAGPRPSRGGLSSVGGLGTFARRVGVFRARCCPASACWTSNCSV